MSKEEESVPHKMEKWVTFCAQHVVFCGEEETDFAEQHKECVGPRLTKELEELVKMQRVPKTMVSKVKEQEKKKAAREVELD